MTNLHKLLKERRDREVREAARLVAKAPDADLAVHLRRIETYSKLLVLLPSRFSAELRWALGIVLVCVATAGLLWIVPVPRSRLVLRASSSAVRTRLGQGWVSSTEPLRLGRGIIRLENIDDVHSAALAAQGIDVHQAAGSAWLQSDVEAAGLGRLSLGRGADLTVEVKQDGVFLFVKGAELAGEIDLYGAARITVGSGSTSRSAVLDGPRGPPEDIHFRAHGERSVPAVVRIPLAASWDIRGVAIESLDFAEDAPTQPDQVQRPSAITAGAVELYDVSRSVPLGDGDQLLLDGVRGELVELRISAASLSTHFQGTAAGIAVGPRSFVRQLAPRYLEYLYHQQPLGLLWSTAVFLGGLLWSAKRLLLA